MNRFDRIEETAANLRDGILSDIRGHTLLLKLCDLTELLDGTGDPLLLEATLTEFAPYFVRELSKFRVEGNQPGLTKRVIACAEKIRLAIQDETELSILTGSLLRLKKELKLQRLILSGNPRPGQRHTPNFPVIETVEGSFSNCLLDTIRVVLRPGKGEDKFILHPATSKKDRELEDQIRTCYRFARRSVETGKSRLSKFFDVQIDLLSDLGIYSGRSFGALLTLLLVIELKKRLHPNRRFGLRADISVTGGIDADGNMLPTGKEAIEQKTKAVFFSFSNAFILPADDLVYAQKTLSELQRSRPNRKLELIAVKNINDIFNRRDIFRVSRKPVKQRVKEWARKYRYGALLFLPAIVLLGFFFAREFDNNPVSFELDGTNLLIKNKYGGVLWSWTVSKYIERDFNVTDLNTRIMISDINEDDGNEVIFSDELFIRKDPQAERVLLCLNSDQEELWRFSMRDTLSSPKESNIPPEFSLKIFDTVTINNSKRILLWTNSVPTYPSAIITIDPRTGKRFPGTIWNAGFIQQVAFEDIDDDQHEEIIFMAVDNGLKIQKIVACEFTDREYMLDTRSDYFLNGKLRFQPIFEISIPSTDYNTTINKVNKDIFFDRQIRMDNDGRLKFFSRYHHSRESVMYTLVLKTKTLEIDYFIEGTYRDHRDSLVNAGKLPLPYTDTKEYTDILKNGVRYKLDGKWVTYQEYVKAGKVKALTPKKK